jgi:hypothetical protein
MNFQYILSNVPSVGAVMEEFSGLEGCLCIKECSSESGCSCLVKGVVGILNSSYKINYVLTQLLLGQL